MASSEERARRKRMRDQYLRAEQQRSAALMPLSRPRLETLITFVDAAVATDGCDHTRRVTDAWALRESIDLETLHRGLEEYSGFCDCEVVLNVDPEQIFTPVRQTHG